MSIIKTTQRANPTYSGISFPPRKGAGYGFFYMAGDLELIENSIRVILNTKKGSMPMNYEFGSSAQSLLFEPINSSTQALIADAIQNDIEKWEPRVVVNSISTVYLENSVLFQIVIQVKATGQQTTINQSYPK